MPAGQRFISQVLPGNKAGFRQLAIRTKIQRTGTDSGKELQTICQSRLPLHA